MEIEQELMVEKDIYFNIDLIMNDKNLSKIGAMIMSYLNFESFASKISAAESNQFNIICDDR